MLRGVAAAAAWAAVALAASPPAQQQQQPQPREWIASSRSARRSRASYECGPADAEHLSESLPAQGLHVLAARGKICGGSAESFALEVFVDGAQSFADPARMTMELPCSACPAGEASCGASLDSLLLAPVFEHVQQRRPLLHRHLRQVGVIDVAAAAELAAGTLDSPEEFLRSSNVFTPAGTLVQRTVQDVRTALQACGTLYLIEGGPFVWPGVRVGYNRTLRRIARSPDDRQREVVLTTLSLMPLLFRVAPLLNSDECSSIIAQAEPKMAASSVRHAAGVVASHGRTSSQCGLAVSEANQVLSQIQTRAHRLLRVGSSHGEPVQVLRYLEGERYDSHHDYFAGEQFGDDDTAMRRLLAGGRNRLATLLWCMEAPDAGGETYFPRADGLSAPPRLDCEPSARGAKVTPRAGDAVLFYNLRPDGAPDPYSLHAGCSVAAGVKWAANLWVWNKPL